MKRQEVVKFSLYLGDGAGCGIWLQEDEFALRQLGRWREDGGD